MLALIISIIIITLVHEIQVDVVIVNTTPVLYVIQSNTVNPNKFYMPHVFIENLLAGPNQNLVFFFVKKIRQIEGRSAFTIFFTFYDIQKILV